jgi:hypothetical protein
MPAISAPPQPAAGTPSPADGDAAAVRRDARQLGSHGGQPRHAAGLARVGHRHAGPDRRPHGLQQRRQPSGVRRLRHRPLRRHRPRRGGSPVTTGITSIGAQGLQVAAGGGNFLLVFNGTSAEQQFDGTAWAPWTGTGTPRLTWANQFKTRIMCGRSDVLSFWYGPPCQHRRRVHRVPAPGRVQPRRRRRGWHSWTLDGGNGPDDYFVCITTEGEMVVFKGTDPSSTTAWGLVGKWNLPRPIGNRFLRPFGGDVLVLTEGGIYPQSGSWRPPAWTRPSCRRKPIRGRSSPRSSSWCASAATGRLGSGRHARPRPVGAERALGAA